MIVGIPKEIKNNENRVGLTPAGARELVKRGHQVYVQASAGENSGMRPWGRSFFRRSRMSTLRRR